jgi:hypothetical protein
LHIPFCPLPQYISEHSVRHGANTVVSHHHPLLLRPITLSTTWFACICRASLSSHPLCVPSHSPRRALLSSPSGLLALDARICHVCLATRVLCAHPVARTSRRILYVPRSLNSSNVLLCALSLSIVWSARARRSSVRSQSLACAVVSSVHALLLSTAFSVYIESLAPAVSFYHS